MSMDLYVRIIWIVGCLLVGFSTSIFVQNVFRRRNRRRTYLEIRDSIISKVEVEIGAFKRLDRTLDDILDEDKPSMGVSLWYIAFDMQPFGIYIMPCKVETIPNMWERDWILVAKTEDSKIVEIYDAELMIAIKDIARNT